MTLLLVGIVAVILVILVAAYLTFRRGQDDDQDETGGRWAVRGPDGHWRSPAQELRRPHRPGRGGPSRRTEEPLRGDDEPPPAYATRRAGRGNRAQPDDRGYQGRPTQRYADASVAPDNPADRGRGTRAAGPPPAGRPGPRQQPDGYDAGGGYDSGGYETVSFDSGPREQLYDTGPSPAMARSTSVSGEHTFAPEHDDDPALTDSDVFPRIRTDTPPPASKPPAPAKGRSRQPRSKRGDDDDWPSTEWDKLSDEQYWAELSADKPLATTARAAQPSTPKDIQAASGPTQVMPAQPKQPQPRPAQPKPAQARPAAPAPGRPAPAPSRPAKPQPERQSVAPGRRDRHQEQTEALPVRGRARRPHRPQCHRPQCHRPQCHRPQCHSGRCPSPLCNSLLRSRRESPAWPCSPAWRTHPRSGGPGRPRALTTTP